MPAAPSPQQRADESRIDDGIDAMHLCERHDPEEWRCLHSALWAVGILDPLLSVLPRRPGRAWHVLRACIFRLNDINQDEDARHRRWRERNRSYRYVPVVQAQEVE